MSGDYDAIITGSGPNGLAAAILLQQNGLRTIVLEQSETAGGACASAQLTLPGFIHDIGSAIHPLAFDSPFFKTLPLERYGLQWIHPPIPFAHPFADGDAYACYNSIEQTALQLGNDNNTYGDLFSMLIHDWEHIGESVLGPFTFPGHPIRMARFGLKALTSAAGFARRNFKDEKTRLLFYGAAAHSTLPLDAWATASFGLVLNILAHRVGWPFPMGGAGEFSKALVKYYQSLGGEVVTGYRVTDINKLPGAKAYLFDLTPRQLLQIGGTRFTSLYRKRLQRFKYGAGVFKLDYALSQPIPFIHEKCRQAGTVHIGFSTKEIELSEKLVNLGKVPERPYLLVCQHTVFDSTRAPQDKHTAWVYCHVPHNSPADMTHAIEEQIERAAPGFRDCILHRHSFTAPQLEQLNPNLVGGDINGGQQNIFQLFTRPVARLSPYSTPDERVFICSSSTPPGGGVHGMGGYHAGLRALKEFQKQ
jgi:phytoene dehydrogenase-like protein